MSSSTVYYGVGTSGLQVFSLPRWTKGETIKSQRTDSGEIRERFNESDALVFSTAPEPLASHLNAVGCAACEIANWTRREGELTRW